MHRVMYSLVLVSSTAAALAQPQPDPAAARKALLREWVSQDSGEITALEPSVAQAGGVVVGYSSGAVSRCDADRRCLEYSGTPDVAVERIAVSALDASDVVWVGYRQGALYQCTGAVCTRVARPAAP